MSRSILPIIKITIAAVFLLLVVSLGMVFITPSFRSAEKNRRAAVSGLFGANGSIGVATSLVAAPYSGMGSLANLMHYLSKDPGRERFIRRSDQRRAQAYLEPLSSEIDLYTRAYSGYGVEWTPNFLASTRALFELIERDLLGITGITGIPDTFADMSKPAPGTASADEILEKAIEDFSSLWVPFGETPLTYQPDKQRVRDYLIKSRRFKRAMTRLDNSWRSLIAILYNLSINPHWQTAVSFDPSLENELNALTVAVLSGDIHRRSRDIMAAVPESRQTLTSRPTPGIRWNPNLSFYKNIPELNGQTKDLLPTFFFVKINIGYTSQDGRTQTWLNKRKDWLSDYLKSYFANMESQDLSSFEGNDSPVAEWSLAVLKARIIHPINSRIALEHGFGSQRVFGIRELALSRVYLISDK